jgi:ElaB/YqjD/DUF883 family membrane-anchored ribosome-binding protein
MTQAKENNHMLSFLRDRSDPHSSNGIHGMMSETAATAAGELGQRLADVGAEAKKQFGDVEELIKTWIKTRPGLTLGAAVAAGVLIGWLIKRR